MKNKKKNDIEEKDKSLKTKETKKTKKKEKTKVTKKNNKIKKKKNKQTNYTKDEKKQTSKKPKKRTFKPRKILLIGAIVVLVLLLMFYLILPTMLGSMRFLIVLSGSMAPAINPGDVVVSVYTNPEEIKINDIITFAGENDPDNYITHRVASITNESGSISFQTKGDANEEIDSRMIQSSELVGKITLTIPYLGYVFHFARSPLGLITFIVIPGILIIVGEVWNITKIKKETSENNKDKKSNKSDKKKNKSTKKAKK